MFAPLKLITEKISYAKVVSRSMILTTDDASTSNKGNYVAIKINQQIYEQQLALCQHALIAKIILARGETPWKLSELKEKLSKL